MTSPALPLTPTEDGVVLTVKLTPRAGRTAIDGIAEEPGPDGPRLVLKMRVTAVPEDGKANAALVAHLAKSWRLPKRSFTLIAGDTQRVKRIHIAGARDALLRDLAARLTATIGGS